IYTQTYTYRDIDSTKTTAQVSSVSYVSAGLEETFLYRYDSLGNIIKFQTADGIDIDYVYDSMGQLIEYESDRLYTFTYDKGGNILTATDEGVSHTYTYGDPQWADLLTAFDGQAITYDASGNPLSYYNGTRYTFTWAEGRRLVSAVKGNSTYTYAYDSDGLRVSKTVNGVKHEYFYASGKLLRETYGNITLDFLYNSNGYPYALLYTNGDAAQEVYYYITNLQGDVMYMMNSAGGYAATYEYGPYGEVIAAYGTIAQTNPLRYRGYYYDSETGFYYLQSRYYDPTICRFINADAYASTGQGILGHNMFSYCRNNPVFFSDPSGYKIVLDPNATDEQIEQYERAIAYLKTSDTARRLIERLENSSCAIIIIFIEEGPDVQMSYRPESNAILFDVYSGLYVGNKGEIQSAALGLAHEMGHAAQDLDGELDSSAIWQTENANLKKYENPIAMELGEPTRKHYLDTRGIVTMNNSTHYVAMVEHKRPFWHYILFWNLFTPNERLTDFNAN
ncbi:MAG: RHS repeat domain-containing protein, partial [Faecousia sp.]